jgi:hypothetical protein
MSYEFWGRRRSMGAGSAPATTRAPSGPPQSRPIFPLDACVRSVGNSTPALAHPWGAGEARRRWPPGVAARPPPESSRRPEKQIPITSYHLTYLRQAASGLSTVIDPRGHTITHTYDARNRRTTERAARTLPLDSMSDVTDPRIMRPPDKPLVWVHGAVKCPPLPLEGRLHAGVLLRLLQRGEVVPLPDARPMQALGPRCHELRR